MTLNGICFEIAAHSYTPTLDILLSFFCYEQRRCEIVGNYFPCGLCGLRSCLIYRVGLPTGLKGKKKKRSKKKEDNSLMLNKRKELKSIGKRGTK